MKHLHVLLLAVVALAANVVSAPAARAEAAADRMRVTSLSYVLSIPTAGTADHVDNSISYRGLGIEWGSRFGLTDLNWSVSLRWLYFRDVEEGGTYTKDNVTASGRLYRAVDSVPFLFHVKYPFGDGDSSFLPFIGLGAGGIYGQRQLDLGTLSANEYGWQFAMAPEVGALIRMTPGSVNQLFINARYDAGFGSSAISAISNLSFAIGFAGGL